MKTRKGYFVVGLIIAFALFFELAAHADESDRSTIITFDEPIQVPGQVLPAGTYVFRLADPEDTHNIVQIFNSDRTVLYATIPTVTAARQQPTDDTAVTLAKQGPGKPEALLKWFYPGRETGNEFVYSRQEEKALARDIQQTIVTNQRAVPNSEASGAGN